MRKYDNNNILAINGPFIDAIYEQMQILWDTDGQSVKLNHRNS